MIEANTILPFTFLCYMLEIYIKAGAAENIAILISRNLQAQKVSDINIQINMSKGLFQL